jgi:hypothetical protein
MNIHHSSWFLSSIHWERLIMGKFAEQLRSRKVSIFDRFAESPF